MSQNIIPYDMKKTKVNKMDFLKIINLYEIHKMMLFQLGPGIAYVLGPPTGLRMTHGYC